jgi:hypothetical protein
MLDGGSGVAEGELRSLHPTPALPCTQGREKNHDILLK